LFIFHTPFVHKLYVPFIRYFLSNPVDVVPKVERWMVSFGIHVSEFPFTNK